MNIKPKDKHHCRSQIGGRPGGTPFLALILFFGVSISFAEAQQTITYTNGEISTSPITITAPKNPTTLQVDGTNSATQRGVIGESGISGAVLKAGPGQLVFEVANTYTGATTISNGTLYLGFNSSIATSSGVNLTGSSATLYIGGDANQTIQDLSGVAGSTVSINCFGSNSGSLIVGTANSTQFDGVLAGEGGLIKQGSGTLTLTGANTFLGLGDGFLQGVTITSTGTLAVSGAGASTTTYDGVFVGAVSGDKSTLLVSNGGRVNESDGVFIADPLNPGEYAEGTATVTGIDSKGAASTIYSTGFLSVAGGIWGDAHEKGTLNVADGGQVVDTYIGGGDAGNTDTGTVLVTGVNANGTASSLSTHNLIWLGSGGHGTMTVSEGGQVSATGIKMGANSSSVATLNLASGGRVTTNSIFYAGGLANLNFDGGILRSSANSADFISGFSPGDVTLQSGGGTIDSNSYAVTVNAVISGSGSLTITDTSIAGTGMVSLTATNTYSGGTAISGGVLQINNGGALGSGGVAVQPRGTLTLYNDVTLANNLTISGTGSGGQGALYSYGDGAARTATINGKITLADDATIGNGSNNAGLILGPIDLSTHTLNLGTGSGIYRLNGDISGSGGLVINSLDSPVVIGGGINTFTGLTEVVPGARLELQDPIGVAVSGDLTIGKDGIVFDHHGAQLAASTTLTLIDGAEFKLISTGTALISETIAGIQGTSSNSTIRSTQQSPSTGSSTLILTGSANYAYAGQIADTSGGGPFGSISLELIKRGTGTQTLSGNNAYSGGTLLSGGQLNLNSPTALGKGNLTIDGGTTLDNTSGAPITLTNNNPQVWNGNFTFAGSNNLDMGTGAVTMNANTQINVNGNTLTEGGAIGGNGSGLIKTGGGTLTLSGSNSYTGGTLVQEGTLKAGAAAAIVGHSAFQVSGGTLDLNGFDLTISSLSGSGGAVSLGTAQLTLDQTNVSAYAGSINGVGSLVKTGPGTFILSGLNSYTGNTTVDAGLLQVDGTLAGNVSVNSGGIRGGKGRVGGVTNNGSVSPGDSPGTLHVAGNYTQTGAGSLNLQIASSSSFDLLAVGGAANLAGNLKLIRLNNFTPSNQTKLTVLTAAGGVHGTFDTVVNGFAAVPMMDVNVLYGSNNVTLEFLANFTQAPNLTPNQAGVAAALTAANQSSGMQKAITYLLGQPTGSLPAEFDLIAPEELTSIFTIAFTSADVQNSNIERHLMQVRNGVSGFSSGFTATTKDGKAVVMDGKNVCIDKNPSPEDKRWSYFLEGAGEFSNVGSTNNASGYDFTTAGVSLGLDYRLNEHFALGFSGGYANTDADLVNRGGIRLNGGKAGVYATVFGGGFYADVLAGTGIGSFDTTRSSLQGRAQGSTNGWELDTLINGGYDIHLGRLSFGPTVSLAYTQATLDGFTEHGSLVPLQFGSQSQDSLRTNLGGKISYATQLKGITITPEVRVSWQHEYLDSTQSIGSRFANAPETGFTAYGPTTGRDSALVSAGISLQLSRAISVYSYYDGQVGRQNFSSNNVSGGVKIDF